MSQYVGVYYNELSQYMTTNDIDYIKFINDYKSIEYNEQNICCYMYFALYLNYDKTNEFINYIINEYILKYKLPEYMKHFEIVIEKINDVCYDAYNKLTDDILLYLNNHIPITRLNVSLNREITDKSIKYLTNLTTLIVIFNKKITDESVNI